MSHRGWGGVGGGVQKSAQKVSGIIRMAPNTKKVLSERLIYMNNLYFDCFCLGSNFDLLCTFGAIKNRYCYYKSITKVE